MRDVSFAAPMMNAKTLSLSDLQLLDEPSCERLTAEVVLALKDNEVGMISLWEIQG
jgi:hypothetical protein